MRKQKVKLQNKTNGKDEKGNAKSIYQTVSEIWIDWIVPYQSTYSIEKEGFREAHTYQTLTYAKVQNNGYIEDEKGRLFHIVEVQVYPKVNKVKMVHVNV